MKARISKLVGTLFVTLAVFNLMFRVLGGPELSMLPWPVSLIVIAIGVFLLTKGGGIEGWSGPRGRAGRLSSISFADEASDWRGRRIMPDTPLRMAIFLAAVAVLLWGVMAVIGWGFESRHWSPPIVAMTSLTVSGLSLAIYSLFFARNRRRNRRTHV